jgi:hypothetical protein
VKKDRRVPKSEVIELLQSRGLEMRRSTLKNGRRAWVVSDGNAFPTLKAVYVFYYHKENKRKKGINFLLDKIRNG